MFIYNFTINRSGELLTLTLNSPHETQFNSKTPVIGTMGDHNAQQFVFERPGFEEYDLVLLFSGGGKRFPEQNLKQGNSFLLPNALTQSCDLSMQVQIRDGLEVIASSQYMTLAFRLAVIPGTDSIEPLPDPLGTIAEKGVTRIECIQNTLNTYNQYGQLLEFVSLPAGTGAGQDGVTPHIGDNGNWCIGDTDTGIPATGPQGERGPQGLQGENFDPADLERITGLERASNELAAELDTAQSDITALQDTIGTLNEALEARLRGDL